MSDKNPLSVKIKFKINVLISIMSAERPISKIQRLETNGTEQHVGAGTPNTGLRTLVVFKDGQAWVPHESKSNIFRRVLPRSLTTSSLATALGEK